MNATGIEARVCADIAERQKRGMAKYGMTLDGNPATREDRIRHAYEEALDLAVYLRWELEKTESGIMAEIGDGDGQPVLALSAYDMPRHWTAGDTVHITRVEKP